MPLELKEIIARIPPGDSNFYNHNALNDSTNTVETYACCDLNPYNHNNINSHNYYFNNLSNLSIITLAVSEAQISEARSQSQQMALRSAESPM